MGPAIGRARAAWRYRQPLHFQRSHGIYGDVEYALVHSTTRPYPPALDVSIARFDSRGQSRFSAFTAALEADTMANGTVKWFNSTKGYGFIQPEDGGNDVFVHISSVERAGMTTLNEGQRVAYEMEKGRNGKYAAVNLRKL